MKIYNKGRGVHNREIVGIGKLQTELPSDWMAFTNLELALPYGGREIDIILVIEDRIIAVDIKDWRGRIESVGGSWSNGGVLISGSSPVEKILQNARELQIMLDKYLRSGGNSKSTPVPKVEGFVVLTATQDRSGIAPTEVNKVFSIDPFIKMLKSTQARINQIGGVAPAFYSPGLITREWKERLLSFFNVNSGNFKEATIKYGSYQAESHSPSFKHPKDIYREFDVIDKNAGGALGLLRKWSFENADPRFQNEDARNEIAGRERKVISWLNDRNPDCESSILQPRVDDLEKSIHYWEVFDRRRKLNRLADISKTKLDEITPGVRIELIRQILSHVKVFHDLAVPHLDIGLHSIWVEAPSMARISHLLAAKLPETKTLGKYRYQFLSSVTLPDDLYELDVCGMLKDVFLLGAVAHYLLFGLLPKSKNHDDPPEWDASVDVEGVFLDWHPWFSRALDWEPINRFTSAGIMLDELNAILQSKPNSKQIFEGLEHFRTLSSQLKVFQKYPLTKELRDDNSVAMWISQTENKAFLVKVWKREGWGDQSKEAPKILVFLQQCESLILDHQIGCSPIREVIWTGDAIILVQDYIDASNLEESLISDESFWHSQSNAFDFLEGLINIVILLHERQLAHGDLKPQNILVTNPDYQPVLIDLLDFSPTEDGERITNAYAPKTGGRFERDCFAVTKIAEEVLANCDIEVRLRDLFSEAIHRIRTENPQNGTLLPLLEVMQLARNPEPESFNQTISISISGIEKKPFFSDEGMIGLRLAKYGKQLRLRGAVEELIFELNEYGVPTSARRVPFSGQKAISFSQKNEFIAINALIEINSDLGNNFSGIESLLKQSDISLALENAKNSIQETSSIFSEEDDSDDDLSTQETVADDDVLNEIVSQQDSIKSTDVPTLWKRLIEVESDLMLMGTVTAPSSFNKKTGRHLVPFQLDLDSFDFSSDDTVSVLKEEKSGRWNKIGRLDTVLSTPNQLQIDTQRWGIEMNNMLQEDQRVRFDSHFEVTSRARRKEAIERILSRQSRLTDLIDIFDSSDAKSPFHLDLEIDRVEIEEKYSLNSTQAEAFVKLTRTRPLSLLQGPPGTGKTRFIAALVHFALTNGLAKNVLIASQSHEAVNGAAEAILKLFKGANETPSILRIGHESNVSDSLLPYHVGKVENLFKDRFRAEFKERLKTVGESLDIPIDLVENLIFVQVVIRPVVETLLDLLKDDEPGAEVNNKVVGLQSTLAQLLSNLPIEIDEVTDDFLDLLSEMLASNAKFTNLNKVKNFSNVANLARDFIGSVSSWQRSFEAFLAGTRQIVAGTCVGLGRSSLGLTSTPFDLVIVDEAARCNSGELAVPLQCGRWIVLVGDHFQLEPQSKSNVVRSVAKELGVTEREVLKSDFERVFDSKYGSNAGYTLKTQYRMLPAIGNIVSQAFYNKELLHGRTEPLIPPEVLPDSLIKPLVWLKTDNFSSSAFQKEAKGRKGALTNPVEADLIVELLRSWDKSEQFMSWLESQTSFSKVIGLICTYRAQSELLQLKLRNAFLSEAMRAAIKIDTVDSYQGKENPIIILSLVRNNEEGIHEEGTKTIKPGFMARKNRLNVAISRAMDRLVIVGAYGRWLKDSPMGRLVDGFTRHEASDDTKVIDGVSFRGLLDINLAQKTKSKQNKTFEGESK
ncbi:MULTISPECIES: AAA domain-containing protein [unclassified Methylophilus]|uniref:AAA domain-containing protein n=1 Tax=unclassified Methylophilus TaxID=2630143 RepID=UPI0006F8D0EA|nr:MULTISPECIES: AAA domain-containing protein [unclassified Methylophilus]KQT41196.1 hypothetical protein ASG34_10575 [Methylophilus sp. Leaf416]KQT58406.1 hypothetical protein ASG44_12130 [Methylophilus sp. Leaf459]